MKPLFLLLSFFGFHGLAAQDCKGHLYMTANASLQMTIYDKKGKQSGVQTIKIANVKNTGGAYESEVATTLTDEKGKVLSTSTGVYRCNNGVFSADMRAFLPREGTANNNPNTEVTFDPVFLEYPSSLSVGQALKPADFNMDMNSNGMKSSLNFKEENRTVTAKESVSSPAGTWEAYVISYDGTVKTKMAGIGLPAFAFNVKEWFVPGLGIVKSETYSKSGKLVGSSLLTGISK